MWPTQESEKARPKLEGCAKGSSSSQNGAFGRVGAISDLA